MFLSHGAKLEVLTRSGQNPMHLGAKSDQILMLAWLRNRDIDAEASDRQDFTPLHYASMMSCELATAVLLSWRVSVNPVNKKGQTPLHLAVLSGSQRIIRSLLMRGAGVSHKDIDGKTPLDLANEKGNEEVISLIKSPGLLSVCGIKPPQRPIKFKAMLMTIYIFLLVLGAFSLVFVLEIDDKPYVVLWVLEVLSFVVACCKDPGYLKKHHEHKMLELASNTECFQICPECVTKRPPRSRHCQCCNKCVEKFDHHCPWINNCIGARNLGVFYCFLVITFVFLLATSYECIAFVMDADLDAGALLAAAWAVVALGFLVPLFLLISVQTRNLLSNTTTNERYSRRVDPSSAERSESDDGVDRSSFCSNIVQMCCNTHSQEYKTKNSAEERESITRYSVIASEYNAREPLLNNNSD